MALVSCHGGWKAGNIVEECRILLPDLPPTGPDVKKNTTFHGAEDASNLAFNGGTSCQEATGDTILGVPLMLKVWGGGLPHSIPRM